MILHQDTMGWVSFQPNERRHLFITYLNGSDMNIFRLFMFFYSFYLDQDYKCVEWSLGGNPRLLLHTHWTNLHQRILRGQELSVFLEIHCISFALNFEGKLYPMHIVLLQHLFQSPFHSVHFLIIFIQLWSCYMIYIYSYEIWVLLLLIEFDLVVKI